MSRFFIPVFLIIMFLMSCGDDGSSASAYEQIFETSSSLNDDNMSSSVDDSLSNSTKKVKSSSSQTIDKSSGSIKNGNSSSSEEKKNSSSSKVLEESSSSIKNGNSSSSVEKKNSSSSKVLEESSSSIENGNSSSSVGKKASSSSETLDKSSSSIKTEPTSSSELPIESSSSVVVEESSSSVLSSSSMNSIYDAENNTLTDLRDNQVYKTVTIGDQIWMAENLNYMPEDTAGTIYSGATVCGGGELDSQEDSGECSIFGRLYLGSIVFQNTTSSNHQGVCPDGWIVPLKKDFETMISFLGEKPSSKLKKDDGMWSNSEHSNLSGFSAVKAGAFSSSLKKYSFEGNYIFYFEKSSQYTYFFRLLDKQDDIPSYSYGLKHYMYSVRCLKK